jgi:hypothetical protein
MQAAERVEVGEMLLENRRIPCVCLLQEPMKYRVLSARRDDGCSPIRRIACSCGKTWTRIG